MELRRLLRLRPDYKDEEGWRPKTRVEFMTIAAKEALRDGNCAVVGGFIRDWWIIRGEIDQARIPQKISTFVCGSHSTLMHLTRGVQVGVLSEKTVT